jgi:hypothetical protein
LPSIGMTRNITATYQISRYCSINGSNSGVAPNKLKSGRIDKKPQLLNIQTVKSPSINPLTTKLALLSSLPWPSIRANEADKPLPKPMITLDTIKDIGKVKLMAASSDVPSKLTNQVSTRLKASIVNIPKPEGMLILVRVWTVEPCSRFSFKRIGWPDIKNAIVPLF